MIPVRKLMPDIGVVIAFVSAVWICCFAGIADAGVFKIVLDGTHVSFVMIIDGVGSPIRS